MVLQQQVSIGQVPTTWSYSDIGTKPLSKARLLALMNQLGATDPDTMTMIGQEEYEVAAEHIQSQQNLKRLSKMVFRMAAAMGLESGFQGAVAIEIKETCATGQSCTTGQASGLETGQVSAFDGGNFWLWLAIILLLILLVGLAFKGYRMIKNLEQTIQQVWNQVADEDSCIATQEQRIDTLIQKCDSLQNQLMQFSIEIREEVRTVSNETSMVHDYASGLHYAIVENGGFLRNGLGLSHQQWVHLTTLERGNLVSSRVMMGSVQWNKCARSDKGMVHMDKQMTQMHQWMMMMMMMMMMRMMMIRATNTLLQIP